MDVEIIPLSKKVKLESLKTVTDSNLLSYSEDFGNDKWNGYLGTKKLSSTNILNPFGTSTVSAISGTSSILQDTEKFNKINSVGQYTFSIYVNVSSNTASSTISPTIWVLNPVSCAAGCSFNVKTGKFLSTNGTLPLDSYHSEYAGNGWYRYSITTTQISSVETAIRCEAYYNISTALTGNLIAWGAQLEKGKNYGTYVKTSKEPKISLIEHGFVNSKKVEPSLGLPYIKNILTYSQTYSSWNSSNVSLSGEQKTTLSPNNNFDSYKIIPNSVNGTHFISLSAKVNSPNAPYTFSTFFKASAYRYAALKISTLEDNNSTYLTGVADISAGNILSLTGNNVFDGNAKITQYENKWYRFSITGTYSSFRNFNCQIYSGAFAISSMTFTGNNNSHILIWGSQLEKGANTSKYIETNSKNKTGISYTDISSSTDYISSYYFPLFADTKNKSIQNSRRFTGNDTIFLSGKYLSYKNNNPKYNIDISGTFHALSAFIPTLSTNYFKGIDLYFNDFQNIVFDSDVTFKKVPFANYISANNVFITSLSSLSTRFDYISVPSTSADIVFSSITWNVTAGGSVSARNIRTKDSLISTFLSSKNSYFNSLTSDNFTVISNLTSISSISSTYIHGYVQIDPLSLLYYNGNSISTRLSATYFFGVKPSDTVNATDNISVVRSLTGAWDGGDGSIIETLPVYKPYFKNIKQVFDYVSVNKLYGEDLNILIYDDLIQNNINNDGTNSSGGCSFNGNIEARYYRKENLPTSLQSAGLKTGDYVWNQNSTSDINGKISYWGVDRLNFKNVNFLGMYEIGTSINSNLKKQYSYNKPFNYSPRKISFNTYVCSNPALTVGDFGTDASAWTSLYVKPSSNVFNRPIYFNGDEMDVNIQNLCFEFNSNATDSTCLYFKSGNSYIINVTVAALGASNYEHGAVLAWPKSNVYICGTQQTDPYLLTPANWGKWTLLKGAVDQNYYPGYGLAIVGNSTTQSIPTLFSTAFLKAWRSNIYVMDYDVNRKIGRDSYLNASLILDGKFSSQSFYELKDHAKVFANTHIFITNNFSLSNYNANVYDRSQYNGKYINVFQNTNRGNFYYFNFLESFSTFYPEYFTLAQWTFKNSEQVLLYQLDKNIFSSKLISQQDPKYIFNTTTKTICVSGILFQDYQKNILHQAMPLNDSFNLYEYKEPNELPSYNLAGIYSLISPIDEISTYTLNFYTSSL
jgi:hypothetical protein